EFGVPATGTYILRERASEVPPQSSLSISRSTCRVPSRRAVSPSATPRLESKDEEMYDMYPDWGPARNNPESRYSHQAVQAALDLRDNGGERPDDN
ncbi:MAG TPA: hypothetical protein VHO29_03800, partial [Marmoricola sp.]|nr:hypothetical protein [Marmoricola sp.]